MMHQNFIPQPSGRHLLDPYKFFNITQHSAMAVPTVRHHLPDISRATGTVRKSTSHSRGRGAPRKNQTNSLKHYLRGFSSPGSALHGLPYFDNIVTGAVNFDFGNTRPFSKKLVVAMLQRLDVITTEAVENYMQLTLRECTTRHAQKIAQCLRVIEHASRKIAENSWLSLNSRIYDITPCGNESCIICSDVVDQSLNLTLDYVDRRMVDDLDCSSNEQENYSIVQD